MSVYLSSANNAVGSNARKCKKQAPINNMGGITFDNTCNWVIGVQAVRDNGKIVKCPNTNSNAAFIDWVNFTFYVSDFYKQFSEELSKDEKGRCLIESNSKPVDLMESISTKLENILAFGITSERAVGLNFYSKSYVLGDGWGFVCIGGTNQRSTVLVMVNGQGCMASKGNSPLYLYNFLKKLNGRISRVDLSADFFEGEYTVDNALDDYVNGKFSLKGTRPKLKQVGDWENEEEEDGRSIYVGKKINGKELCVYEKGKQLGGDYVEDVKKWNRVELRYGSKDRVIPLDVLLYPGQYLAAGYPALGFISKKQMKIKTAKNTAKIVYEKAKKILKQQFGGLLGVIVEMGHLDDVVVLNKRPERLIMPNYRNLNAVKSDIKMDKNIMEDLGLFDWGFVGVGDEQLTVDF